MSVWERLKSCLPNHSSSSRRKRRSTFSYPLHRDLLTWDGISARKTTNYITAHTISEVVSGLVKQSHISSSKDNLAVLILRYYLGGSNGNSNRKKLEDRLRAAEGIGSLGDYPWTSSFEDVLEKYRARLEKFAAEMVVEEVKGMVERELRDCLEREDD